MRRAALVGGYHRAKKRAAGGGGGRKRGGGVDDPGIPGIGIRAWGWGGEGGIRGAREFGEGDAVEDIRVKDVEFRADVGSVDEQQEIRIALARRQGQPRRR